MWYYTTNGQQYGPLNETALDQLIHDGVVTPRTFVWKEGMADWMPLDQVRPTDTLYYPRAPFIHWFWNSEKTGGTDIRREEN